MPLLQVLLPASAARLLHGSASTSYACDRALRTVSYRLHGRASKVMAPRRYLSSFTAGCAIRIPRISIDLHRSRGLATSVALFAHRSHM